MDIFFEAISLYRRRKYDLCIEKCNALLQTNAALQQGPWELKMRAMTQRVYIDDIEANDGVIGKYMVIAQCSTQAPPTYTQNDNLTLLLMRFPRPQHAHTHQ